MRAKLAAQVVAKAARIAKTDVDLIIDNESVQKGLRHLVEKGRRPCPKYAYGR